jgi:hypothetical protein
MPFSLIGLYGRRKFYKATYKLTNNLFFEYGQEKLKLMKKYYGAKSESG